MRRIERNTILIFRHILLIGCLLLGIIFGIIVTVSGLFQSMYERMVMSKVPNLINAIGRFFQ